MKRQAQCISLFDSFMSPFSSPPRVTLDAPPSPPAKKQGVGCIVAFCALFSLIGAGLIYTLFLRPVAHVVAARSWSAVPCRIVSSNVASHSDSDGTTYSADIVYSYLGSNQITYTSGRYSFGNKIKAGYKGRAGIVAAYPVGSTATCYVNPRVPTEAVLQRGMTGEVWFGLMGLPFLAFGLFGIWAVTRSQREELHPRAKWQPKDAAPTFDPLVLRPKSSPWGRLAGMSFVNAFWNGIVGFMVWKLVIERDGGIGFAVFGFFFFIPFVLIGILIFWGWIQTGLALGNARPTLVLSRSLFPGQNADLRFELNGGIFWPQSVEITLEGREEASFTRGTDTITDTSPFFFQSLHQTSEVRGGNCAISIPTCTMHSLDAPHNKIVWILKLSGPIKHWPDIAEEWPITVFPAPTERNYE